jgi:pimeloyl-ACP methyl ester carboxylesterase
MQFTDHFFDTGEINLHYQEGPKNGPPMVLIHGATGTCHDWSPIQDNLAQEWHVFMVDQRGHGQSGHGAGQQDYHASHNIGDTLAFLREVAGAPAVVWGHSWGAVVTLLSAGAGKEWVRAVVLEDPPVMIRREICAEMQPFLKYFGMLLDIKQSANTLDETIAAIRQFDSQSTDEQIEAWARAVYQVDPNFLRMVLAGPEIVAGIDFAAAIRAATMPVLLMQADPTVGAALVQEDLEFVLANNARFELVQFPGAGHTIHEEQTERALEAFRQFAKAI